jgi:hypothetical protein
MLKISMNILLYVPDDNCRSHAPAYAEACQPVLGVPFPQNVQQRNGDPRAACPQGVPQGDGPAVDVAAFNDGLFAFPVKAG